MSASFFAVAIPATIGLVGLPSAWVNFKDGNYFAGAVGAFSGTGCLVILIFLGLVAFGEGYFQ